MLKLANPPTTKNKARIFRYVRHGQIQSFIAAGWVAHRSLEGTHHGDWSALLEWPHDEPPKEPW